MKKYQSLLLLTLITLCVSACEVIQQQVQTPNVNLVSVQMAEQQGLRQMFDVKLAVNNPNSFALNLAGINYQIALEGLDVINGSANQIPTIPAYGEQTLDVRFGFGILEGLQLMNRLSKKNEAGLNYSLNMQLDTGMPLIGAIPVARSGKLTSESFTR